MLKRTFEGDERPLKRAHYLADRCDILSKVPHELLQLILSNLTRRDIINISTLSHKHRQLTHDTIFDQCSVPWTKLGDLKNFKHPQKVHRMRIHVDENDLINSSKCEWNVSFKPLLSLMTEVNSLDIEVMTSSRCLKYKDDFDEELSGKVKTLRLESRSKASTGDANGECMFELTQLIKFHDIENLRLHGFSLNRDIYFKPEICQDMSDYQKRRRDGRLTKLQSLELIDCQWEYPLTLKDVFAPNYELPNGLKVGKNCSPESISIKYHNESSKFVESERFKMLVNTEYNKNFLFEVDFFADLRHLELVIANDDYEHNRFKYYYPRMNLLNLKRTFYIEDESTGQMVKQCILGNLKTIRLVGWRLLAGLELDKCFKLEEGEQYVLESFELGIKRSSEDAPTAEDMRMLQNHKQRLALMLPDRCKIRVWYV